MQISVTSLNRGQFAETPADDSKSSVAGLVARLANPLGEVVSEQLAVLTSLIEHVKHEVLPAIHSHPIALPRIETLAPSGPSVNTPQDSPQNDERLSKAKAGFLF